MWRQHGAHVPNVRLRIYQSRAIDKEIDTIFRRGRGLLDLWFWRRRFGYSCGRHGRARFWGEWNLHKLRLLKLPRMLLKRWAWMLWMLMLRLLPMLWMRHMLKVLRLVRVLLKLWGRTLWVL